MFKRLAMKKCLLEQNAKLHGVETVFLGAEAFDLFFEQLNFMVDIHFLKFKNLKCYDQNVKYHQSNESHNKIRMSQP